MHYRDGIQTLRLVSRFLTKEDATAWAPFFAHPETKVALPMYNDPDPQLCAEALIERQLSRYAEKSGGLQAILERDSGTLVGLCGLLGHTIDEVKEWEVGYHLLRPYWGKGYATEMAKGFMKYGFAELGPESIISLIAQDNHRSQAVAVRNGLKREKELHYYGSDMYLYRTIGSHK